MRDFVVDRTGQGGLWPRGGGGEGRHRYPKRTDVPVAEGRSAGGLGGGARLSVLEREGRFVFWRSAYEKSSPYDLIRANGLQNTSPYARTG